MNLLIPLFSPATGTWGGLTRAVAVAHAAEAAGHRVAFCASGTMAQNLRGRGYRVYTMPTPRLPSLTGRLAWLLARPHGQMAQGLLSRSLASIWLVLCASGIITRRYLPRLVAAELHAAREYGTDAIFTDLDPGAFIIGRILKVPIATAYAAIMRTGMDTRAYRRVQRAIAPLLAHYGLPALTPGQLFFDRTILKLVPSIPELDGADASQPDIRYVGHLLGAIEPSYPDHCDLDLKKRYVFCYMGTGAVPFEAVRRVLPELFADDERICLVTGYGVKRQEWVGQVLFCPYVDVRQLLPYCDWTLCHGGQNTIIQSLRAGVPLLIFPGCLCERRFNAERVQAQGAGWVGELEDWNIDWLRERMLDRDRPAAAAARLGAEIEALGGAPAAVSAIEEWLRQAVWRQENGHGPH